MYNIGDTIVHPMHGAGIIESITTRTIDGKELDYYTFKLPSSSMTLMIPVATSSSIGVRKVISRERAEKLLSLLPEIEIDETSNWNKRYRENAARIKTGELEEVFAVMKSLAFREHKTGLSSGERKMLHSTRQILFSELTLALDTELPSLEKKVDEILIECFKNR